MIITFFFVFFMSFSFTATCKLELVDVIQFFDTTVRYHNRKVKKKKKNTIKGKSNHNLEGKETISPFFYSPHESIGEQKIWEQKSEQQGLSSTGFVQKGKYGWEIIKLLFSAIFEVNRKFSSSFFTGGTIRKIRNENACNELNLHSFELFHWIKSYILIVIAK